MFLKHFGLDCAALNRTMINGRKDVSTRRMTEADALRAISRE